jgi:hypothetical protein
MALGKFKASLKDYETVSTAGHQTLMFNGVIRLMYIQAFSFFM